MEFSEAKSMDVLVDLISQKKVNLIEFFSETCAPCYQLERIIKQLAANDLTNRECVGFIKINIENFKDLAESFGVLSVPTVMFYFCGNRVIFDADSKKMDRIQGMIPNIGKIIADLINTLSEMPVTGDGCSNCSKAADSLTLDG